jgi:hypothetical protein
MKSTIKWVGIILIGMMLFGMQTFLPDQVRAQADQDLVFTPVEPCRILDTRKPGPVSGVFAPNERRELYVYGTSEISSQGGNPAGCADPMVSLQP